MTLWPHRWTRVHRAETPRERILCKARRALRGVRTDSIELGRRPFSDRYGYDGGFQPGVRSHGADTWDGEVKWKR